MPRILARVNCLKCPLDDVCEWSCSDDIAMDKDGYVYVKDQQDQDAIDMAHNNCPLRKKVFEQSK